MTMIAAEYMGLKMDQVKFEVAKLNTTPCKLSFFASYCSRAHKLHCMESFFSELRKLFDAAADEV